jgi:hypothetical protein
VTIPANLHLHEVIINQNNKEEDKEFSEDKPGPEEIVIVDEYKNKLPLMLIVDDNEDFRNFLAALFVKTYRII